MADDEVTIDWGQASVDGGRLTVPYAGKPPAGFKPALTHVLERSEADQTMTDAFATSADHHDCERLRGAAARTGLRPTAGLGSERPPRARSHRITCSASSRRRGSNRR